MKKGFIFVAVLALLAVLVPGCAPEGAPPPTAEGGIIEIRVTDPPPADVIHAFVTLANIEVHREGGGWETIDLGGEVTFDLMDVIGVEAVLGSAGVLAGSFTGIRLNVTEVVVTIDGYPDPISAEIPSGKLKIVKTFEVVDGVKTVLTLDFDGEKSLILPGKDIDTGIERALFKPVVKLLIGREEAEGELEAEEGEEEEELEGEEEPGPSEEPSPPEEEEELEEEEEEPEEEEEE